MRHAIASAFLILAWTALILGGREPWGHSPLLGSNRAEVLAVLDDLVQREKFHQKVHGTYTHVLGRLGFSVPENLRSVVQVEVLEASRDRLLVHAFDESEVPADHVWMDQNYGVQANFRVEGGRWAKVADLSRSPASPPVGDGSSDYPWGLVVEAIDDDPGHSGNSH